MRKRAQNSNKQFLIGTAAMAFAVMAVVIIFINLCLPYIKPGMEKKQIADLYQIEFSKGFAGDSAMVYLNDSLVWCDLVHHHPAHPSLCRRKHADGKPFGQRCRFHFQHHSEGRPPYPAEKQGYGFHDYA